MRCASVEKLLPLYVEGDLSEPETSAIRSHLSFCEGCGHLSEEFMASQRRLRAFVAPAFDEDFYRSIRSGVLSRINSSPNVKPSIFARFRTLLLPRPALAGAALALLLVLGLAGGIIYSRLSQSGAAHMAAFENSLREIKPNEYREAMRGISSGGQTSMAGEESRNRRRAVSPTASGQNRGVADGTLAPPQDAVAQGSDTVAVSPEPPRTNESLASDSAPKTESVARMEIQTSDPNIRIIWLGRKSSE